MRGFNGYCFTNCVKAEDFSLALLGKSDEGSQIFTTGAANDGKSGTWNLNEDYAGAKPMFVVVKASTQYEIYYAEGCITGQNGVWDTTSMLNGGDQHPAMSHISLYGARCSAVPIPAALWLLSSGLGLLFIRRRKS